MRHVLPQTAPAAGGTAQRILLRLKTAGEQTTADVATLLGISGEGARQHLVRLRREGLVQDRAVRAGVGRPTHGWTLTARGHAQFPDGHAGLAVGLLQSVRHALGEAAVVTLVDARDREIRRRYRASLSTCTTLEARVAGLARLRTEEGYLCEYRKTGDGSFLLVEHHCPICAAASACQAFCHSELATFADLLAPASVTRIEHLQAGDPRCAYRVTPPV